MRTSAQWRVATRQLFAHAPRAHTYEFIITIWIIGREERCNGMRSVSVWYVDCVEYVKCNFRKLLWQQFGWYAPILITADHFQWPIRNHRLVVLCAHSPRPGDEKLICQAIADLCTYLWICVFTAFRSGSSAPKGLRIYAPLDNANCWSKPKVILNAQPTH